MSFKSIFSNVWHWLKNAFEWLAKDGDKVAIAITQDVNLALNSGLADELVKILQNIPGVGTLPVEILAAIKPLVPKIMALELDLQQLPADATPEQIAAFAQEVMGTFASASLYKQTKIYTTIAAETYNQIQVYLKQDGKLTFWDVVKIVQGAFDKWTLDKAQNPDTSSMDALQSPLRTSTAIPTGPAKNLTND